MTTLADLEALTASPRWPVLFVHHGWGGGIARHLRDLQRLIDDHCEVVMLEPATPGVPSPEVRLTWQRKSADGSHRIEGIFSLKRPNERRQLLAALKALGIARIHFHHTHALPPEVLTLPQSLRVPFDVTLHDYSALGPRYHLADHRGRFCGEPQATAYDTLPVTDPAWPHTTEAWRALWRDVLQHAERVIAPSHDIAERIHRLLPAFTPLVWPHPETLTAVTPRWRVATIGALSPEKGFNTLLACAHAAEQQNLPLSFRIFGTTARPLPLLPPSRLSMSGEYDDGDLAALIAAEKPDAFFFPAQVPESFCYALTPALLSGRPIIASALGALQERLRDIPQATLLPWDSAPATWNAALLQLRPLEALFTPSAYDNEADYRQRYLSALPTDPRPARGPLVVVWPHPVDSSNDEDTTPLHELFTAGIECGRRAAREQLQRRLQELPPTPPPAPQWWLDWQIYKETKRQKMQSTARMARNAWLILRTYGVRALLARSYEKFFSNRHNGKLREFPDYKQETQVAPLTLATSLQPRVSILLPAYGEALATFSCLKSIQQHTPDIAYEVLVLDDASPEPLQDSLKDVHGVRFIRQPHNLGFLKNCNAGAKQARGDILVFLNNDTLVTAGWLDALLDTLETVPDAGLVGAQLCYPDGRLQEAGGLVFRDGSAWNYGRNGNPDQPEFHYRRDVDYCSGACIALRKDLFNRLGGFDERFAPAYYEDTDLAFAVRAAGLRVLYQPLARVIHFEGQTSGTDETQGVKRHQVINQRIFADKWATTLANYCERSIDPQPAAQRNIHTRVLVLDSFMLTPDRDSGSLRMRHILELLAQPGHRVTFAADSLEYRAPYVEQLQARGIEVIHRPYIGSIGQLLQERGREFDLIVLSRLEVAARWLPLVREKAPQALVVFDTVDLHFLRAEREADVLGSEPLRARAAEQKKQELGLIHAADRTWVVSPSEAELLAPLAPNASIAVLSNIHAPKPAGLSFAERTGLLFIGSFRHPPNVDAMLWYAQQVLPHVRELLPGVVTTIVGGDAPPSIKALAAADVIVTGYVEDVEPNFTSTRLSIAPLRYGAGVKGKVNQAMSYGVPVIATTIAAEGMHLAEGVDVLIADEARAFAEAIARAYQDAALWQTLSTAGRANIEAHFSPAVAQQEIDAALARARELAPPA